MNEDIVLFNNQLIDAIKNYPNLKIKRTEQFNFLKGILDIPDDHGNIVRQFMVEILYQEGFPYRFPKLFEVGKEIPPLPDWHKYKDNSCCLTVEPLEIIYCKNGITVVNFIKEIAVPYFANQYHKMITGVYKKEYSHGVEGLKECYCEIFRTPDVYKWIEYYEYAFGIRKLNINPNDKCFCGSNLLFKSCHKNIFNNLVIIGMRRVKDHIKEINSGF